MNKRSITAPMRLIPQPFQQHAQSSWRQKGIDILRIGFGVIWAIDAWLKWQPGFQGNFLPTLMQESNGRAAPIHAWISFWVQVVQINPSVFAHLQALGETAVAIGLLLGLFSNLTNVAGFFLALLIWSTGEGFGGPYGPGATDIGTAIIYAVVFVGLFLMSSGRFLAVDHWLAPRLGRWSFLASGAVRQSQPERARHPRFARSRPHAVSSRRNVHTYQGEEQHARHTETHPSGQLR